MAYAPGTVKVVIGGALPGSEQFAFGYQLAVDPSMSQLNLTKLCGEASGALTGDFLTTAVKALFGTGVIFQTVRTYLYTGGAHASLQAENTAVNTPGTSAAAILPLQCATVVSLETGKPGRSQRGRSYLPPLTAGLLNGTGQLASATCTTLANAFASMLTAMNDGTDPAANAVVASATKGASTSITGVRVDSIIDTQRRRRNKLLPAASVFASL